MTFRGKIFIYYIVGSQFTRSQRWIRICVPCNNILRFRCLTLSKILLKLLCLISVCILECIFTLTLITLCCNVWRKKQFTTIIQSYEFKNININFKIFTRTWKCHAKLWSCYEYYFYIIYFRLTGLVICHVMFLLRHNVSSVSFMMFICFVFC